MDKVHLFIKTFEYITEEMSPKCKINFEDDLYVTVYLEDKKEEWTIRVQISEWYDKCWMTSCSENFHPYESYTIKLDPELITAKERELVRDAFCKMYREIIKTIDVQKGSDIISRNLEDYNALIKKVDDPVHDILTKDNDR